VDYEHGKPAITKYEVTKSSISNFQSSIVYLYPQTGRTHQLRVHCAHKDGLDNPILGDTLYGSKRADRLYLHADSIIFIHPTTGEEMTFTSPVPF
jgi:tRNA pseudouridine32 synthase/23S rRNA pseudouridine746 synthase